MPDTSFTMDEAAVRKQGRLHAQWDWDMKPPQGCNLHLFREYAKAYNAERKSLAPHGN